MKKNLAGLFIILIIFSSSIFIYFTYFDSTRSSLPEENSPSEEAPDDPSENPANSDISDNASDVGEMSNPGDVSTGDDLSTPENGTQVEGAYDTSLEFIVPLDAFPTYIPNKVWLDLGVPLDVRVTSYRITLTLSDIREWYLSAMGNSSLMGEGTYEDPSLGVILSHLLFQEEDEGILLLFMRNDRLFSDEVTLGLVRDDWTCFEDYMYESIVDPEDNRYLDNESLAESLFYDYLGLPEGNVTFRILPLSLDAFTWIWPLGHLDPEGGHTFPTSFGMFELADAERYPPHHEVVVPSDGIIVEIAWHEREWPVGSRFTGTYNDYDVKIAHTRDVISSIGHISELSSAFQARIGELTPGVNHMEITVSEGEKIGLTGGRPRAQYRMNWRVFDRNISHFINPDSYGLLAHEAHFIEYCSESLQDVLHSRLTRTSEPRLGVFDFDETRKLVGNWFHVDVNESDPMADWTKHLAFVYAVNDPESVRVSIGGTLPAQIGVYSVYGNSPDPRSISVGGGRVVYWLEAAPEWTGGRLQKRTLLVELIDDERIRVEVFDGWFGGPAFSGSALIFTR